MNSASAQFENIQIQDIYATEETDEFLKDLFIKVDIIHGNTFEVSILTYSGNISVNKSLISHELTSFKIRFIFRPKPMRT